MKTYFVCSRIESRSDGRPDGDYEESIRLVMAEDQFEARTKAESFSRDAEHDYVNDRNEVVSWHFVAVEHIREFPEEEFSDGAEVYSRHRTQDMDTA